MRRTTSLAICAASFALALPACGDLPRHMDYVAQKGTRIDAPIEALGISQLDVYESPRYALRVWVQPTTGRGLALVVNGRQDRWMAMRPEVEPAYRNAAVAFLADKHPACAIGVGSPYPDALAFEFTYNCP